MMKNLFFINSHPPPQEKSVFNVETCFVNFIWLDNYTGPKVLHYRRYVDDIICLFRNSEDASIFFEYLNMCHPNIKFTMETEEKGQLPFLDVLVSLLFFGRGLTLVY